MATDRVITPNVIHRPMRSFLSCTGQGRGWCRFEQQRKRMSTAADRFPSGHSLVRTVAIEWTTKSLSFPNKESMTCFIKFQTSFSFSEVELLFVLFVQSNSQPCRRCFNVMNFWFLWLSGERAGNGSLRWVVMYWCNMMPSLSLSLSLLRLRLLLSIFCRCWSSQTKNSKLIKAEKKRNLNSHELPLEDYILKHEDCVKEIRSRKRNWANFSCLIDEGYRTTYLSSNYFSFLRITRNDLCLYRLESLLILMQCMCMCMVNYIWMNESIWAIQERRENGRTG